VRVKLPSGPDTVDAACPGKETNEEGGRVRKEGKGKEGRRTDEK
jgi:hypothetical protein